MLYHRYRVTEDGSIAEAQIVPPTSQNQARIEEDLVALAPSILELAHDDASHLLGRHVPERRADLAERRAHSVHDDDVTDHGLLSVAAPSCPGNRSSARRM